jgi:regulator of protease activity HflC (stomatin/prohibitin superfamily)
MSTGVAVLLVIVVLVLIVIAAATMISVLQEYERGVIFRLGRVLAKPKGPGLILMLPFGIDRIRKVNLQVVAMNVPPQDVITKDNITMQVDAVV